MSVYDLGEMGFPFPLMSQDIRLALLTHANTEPAPGTMRLFLRKHGKVGVEKQGGGEMEMGTCVTKPRQRWPLWLCWPSGQKQEEESTAVKFCTGSGWWHPCSPALASTAYIFAPEADTTNSSDHSKILLSNLLSLEQWLLKYTTVYFSGLFGF